MLSPKHRLFSLVAACSAGSLITGFVLGNARLATAQKDATPAAINPQEKVLYANLYMQTSAEYRAVCEQTYALAAEKLRTCLASIPVEETKRPAVVMDLDETVLDNSGYQSYIDRQRSNFDPVAWSQWEKDHAKDVGLVPGAREFIDYAQHNGVTVVFITNRSEGSREGTIAALKANDIDTTGIEDRLYLQGAGAPSNKTERRQTVMGKYRVVMLFGDNLRDFDEQFVAPKLKGDDDTGQKIAIADRKMKVDATRNHWGVDWFILPNPTYGEWVNLLGSSPRTKLRQPKW